MGRIGPMGPIEVRTVWGGQGWPRRPTSPRLRRPGSAALQRFGETDYQMRIFNSDGSEPEMCGNGIRCLARFLVDLEGKTATVYRIQTLAGTIVPTVRSDGQVTVDMGEPRLTAAEIPTTLVSGDQQVVEVPLRVDDREWVVTAVSMGNPHCIAFVEDVESIPLEQIGPHFEHHPAFPQRTNTEFIQVVRSDYLSLS